MNWLYVKSIEELKAFGKMKDVKKLVKKDLAEFFKKQKSADQNITEMIKITSGSWVGLYNKICALREFMNTIKVDNSLIEKDVVNESKATEIKYFKSEEDEIIFYLLEMEGKKRSEKLGITRACFINEKEAKKWRNRISKKIHPDKTNNKNATEATAKLNQLYKEMIGDA